MPDLDAVSSGGLKNAGAYSDGDNTKVVKSDALAFIERGFFEKEPLPLVRN